jgi:hypothetical protein
MTAYRRAFLVLELWITRVAVNSPKMDVQQERPIPS